VDCVVLTHAHIDHSGMLPALYKDGFRGPIYATPATMALCEIMLRDSAHIQMQEAQWRNRKAERAGRPLYEPIYDMDDADGVLGLFAPVEYGTIAQIVPGVRLTLTDAGHLLGSASASLTADEGTQRKTIVFSGDIGNLRQPIINDPHYLSAADYVVMESTYGDRLHGERPDYIADLADTLQTTFDRGGKVVIPSFAIGRTQEILYFLREIKQKGLIRGHENFPVFMDSPLAIKATEIFNTCSDDNFDEEMRALIRGGKNPLSFEGLKLCVSADESREINFHRGPGVIISASGMAEAGRIRHHLKHNLWKPEATILFVGYQSVGTLGRALYDGAKKVRLFDEEIEVKAEIRMLRAISGHADMNGLLTWAKSFSPIPAHYFICHGEEKVAESFAQNLAGQCLPASVPYNGDVWDLMSGQRIKEGNPPLVRRAVKETAAAAMAPSLGVSDADRKLQSASSRLRNLLDQASGYSNGLKFKLAEQIEKIIKGWEN
jgi:metallo-beta-lactamase family protein